MKKLNMEATDENVLNAIANDRLQRSPDIKDIIELLETIDYNAFIALDGAWGDGKTFLVREIEMTLRYYYKICFEKEITEEEKNAFSRNPVLNKLDISKSYLPVYYNAWLYDNHDDPLMSLLLIMVNTCQKYLDTKLNSQSIRKKIFSLISSINLSIKDVEISVDPVRIKEGFSRPDILASVKTAEEIRQCVKDVFDEIITGDTQRLIIFIDELDRCKPSYAVEMLERIKHYYDDDRIIFVCSINKAQLIHTISNYYGSKFDSTRYLNKFFDINLQLPPANTAAYFASLGIMEDGSYWIINIANELQKYYHLSLRDSTIYYQTINTIYEKWNNKMGEGNKARMLIVLIPILCALNIIDSQEMQLVLAGGGRDILVSIIDNNDYIKEFINQFSGNREINEQNYRYGLNIFEGESIYMRLVIAMLIVLIINGNGMILRDSVFGYVMRIKKGKRSWLKGCGFFFSPT